MLPLYQHLSIYKSVISSVFSTYIDLFRTVLLRETRFYCCEWFLRGGYTIRSVERCSRSVTRSRRSESPCLLEGKRRKEKMELRHFRPIVSLRALAFADGVDGVDGGETPGYSISMQRAFNEEARRFSRHAKQTLLDYGNRSVAKFDDDFRRQNFREHRTKFFCRIDSILMKVLNWKVRRYSRNWCLYLDGDAH